MDAIAMNFSPCIVIPTYNNPATIRAVVRRLMEVSPGTPILVIDDHSGPEGEREVQALTSEGLVKSRRRAVNGGKGAAVRDGLFFARELGFTHALQIDADGQHCFLDVPRFLEVSRRHPEALVLGCPVYDASAPKSRLTGRKISIFWTTAETGFTRLIDDPLCGLRVYPVEAACASGTRSSRMEFDPEIAVRMAWAGVPLLNLPTRVRYLSADEGGVSHFHPFRDNWMMSLMHTRLCLTLWWRMIRALFGRPRPAMSRIDLPEGDPLLLTSAMDDEAGALPQARK